MRKLFTALLLLWSLNGHARPEVLDTIRTSKELSELVEKYKDCLESEVYDRAKKEAKEEALFDAVFLACALDRSRIISALFALEAPDPLEYFLINIRKPALQNLKAYYYTSKENYIYKIALSKTVHEQCAMANRRGSLIYQSVMQKNGLEDFASLRAGNFLDRSVERTINKLKTEIAITSPEAWCQKIRADLENNERLRRLLFIE